MSHSQSASWLSVGLALSLAASGFGGSVGKFDSSTLFEQLVNQAMKDVNGDLDAPATYIRYLSDGTTETSFVPLREALPVLERIMKGAPAGADNTQATHGFGVGYADPLVSLALAWPFCDVATIYATYQTNWGNPPGSAFAIQSPGIETPEVLAGQVCGAPASDWDDVTLDTRGIVGPAQAHCGGAQVLLDYDNAAYNRGLLGGVLCGIDVTTARGKGEIGTWIVGTGALDFFSGSFGEINLGDEVT